MIGKPPAWVGIGIATPDERSRMGKHQLARKRAEADALKKRFDVDFAGATVADDEPDYVTGEIIDREQKAPPRDEVTIQAELGFS